MPRHHVIATSLLLLLLPTGLLAAEDVEHSIDLLLNRAEAQVWLGIANKGASDAFEEGLAFVEEAETALENARLPPDRVDFHSRQIGDVREQLQANIEIYRDRFYGVYPLARLLRPTLLADDGFGLTEQLFHPPDVAAIEIAGRGLSSKVDTPSPATAVLRSNPRKVELENLAHSVLAQEGRLIPVNRRGLLNVLGPAGLERFDAGDIDQELLSLLIRELNVTNLLVVTINRLTGDGDDLIKYGMTAELYQDGEVIQGSAVDATPAVKVGDYHSIGTVLDRRDQFWPILAIEVTMLLIAVIVALKMRWSSVHHLKPLFRASIGLALFLFGRGFAVICIVIVGHSAPDPSALVAAAWWWPAMLGYATVLLGGLLAWIGQARLTEIVPGTRGTRAVGTLFGLSALGSATYFVAPVLLLEESDGLLTLGLYFFNAVGLAVLFAFAVRTGPPVPTYFALGPILLVPGLSSSLLMGSAEGLLGTTVSTIVLYAAATVRHRYAVARGIEEHEPNDEQAALADQEHIQRLRDKLKH